MALGGEEDHSLGPQSRRLLLSFSSISRRLPPRRSSYILPSSIDTSPPTMRPSTFLSFAALTLTACVVAAPTPAVRGDAVASLEQAADSIAAGVRALIAKQEAAAAEVSFSLPPGQLGFSALTFGRCSAQGRCREEGC